MKDSKTTRRAVVSCFSVVALLMTATSAGGQTPPEKSPPHPLPKEIVKAWTDARAKVGWIREASLGAPIFVTDKKNPKPEDIPAFVLHWQSGELAKLPTPQTPWGLLLINVTDEGLKELASLKNLRNLGLVGTKVTDKGLKELTQFKHLKRLYLRRTIRVTDAGLKELQKALPDCKISR